MKYCLTIWCFACWWLLNAQTPHFKFHPLGGEWEETRVSLVYESASGMLWFGADQGLFQYDGRKYTFWPSGDSVARAVTAIYQDRQGMLWVGYDNGDIYTKTKTGHLTLWKVEEGLPKAPVVAILEDAQGVLWLATYGEGLYYFRNGRMYNLNTDDGLLGNDIYALVKDKNNRLWAATDGGISICALRNGNKSVYNLTRAQGLPDDIVRAILPDEKGNCWVGTYDRGFCYFNTQTWQFEYPPVEWTNGVINCFELYEDRELWIGADGKGVFRYDLNSRQLQQLACSEKSLSSKVVDLHKDIEGNIWVINNIDGVCSANRQFEFILNRLDNIQAVLADSRFQLWVCAQSGLYRYQTNGKSVFLPQLPQLNANVLSLYEDNYQNIWIGTFGGGVYCYQPASGRLRHFSESDGLTNGSVLSIDGFNNKIWLATLGGVTELNFNGNPLAVSADFSIRNFNQESGLGTNFIYKVFVDSKGRTWFGADGRGVSVLDNGRITHYPKAGSIPLSAVYAITEDRRGHIWFSTDKQGIFEFDGEQFVQLTVKEGIREQAITSLGTDRKGNIVMVHQSGVDLLDPQTRHLIYFDEEVGIRNIDPNLNALTIDRLGNVWIGAQHQVLRYTALKENLSIHPRILLDKVSIFLDPVDILKQNEFAHHQNNFIFDFVGLWYTDPKTVKYRYKLEGLNPDWIISGDPRATYSNLPPGNYTFIVSATENDAFDQEPAVSYSFRINTPLWRRPWFLIAAILLIGALLYWLMKQREHRLHREALLNKEKIESQYEALKSQINPHFLFNSFNTLITIIDEDPKLAVAYVEKLSDFYRSILQYREKELIPLKEEIELVKSYAFLLNTRYGDNFGLHIKVNGEPTYVAPLTLQILVENAVKHNVISKARPLNVEIALEEDGYLSVSNNLQPKLTPERSTGFGLQSVRARYALLIDKPILVDQNDRVFKVSIPLIKNDFL